MEEYKAFHILPQIYTAKSCNLPNTDMRNYSIDFRGTQYIFVWTKNAIFYHRYKPKMLFCGMLSRYWITQNEGLPYTCSFGPWCRQSSSPRRFPVCRLMFISTSCPRSLVQFYKVSHYIKMNKTSVSYCLVHINRTKYYILTVW